MNISDNLKTTLMVVFAFLFALVDSLFLGNFIWVTTGSSALFFTLTIIGLPVTTIFKYHSYDSFSFSNLYPSKLANNFNSAKRFIGRFGILIFVIFLAVLYYTTSYGALYIQILRLFTNQFGLLPLLSGYGTFTLVILSIVPDSLLFISDLYKKLVKYLQYSINFLSGKVKLSEEKNIGNIIFCSLIVLFIAAVFTNIEYTQMINSYQHYLIEIANMIIPHVWGKDIIFWLLLSRFIAQFWDLGKYILHQISEFFYFKRYKNSIFNPIVSLSLSLLAISRAIGKNILAGELASNPYHIDAKSMAGVGSIIDDYDQYRGTYTKTDKISFIAKIISVLMGLTSGLFLLFCFMGYVHVEILSLTLIFLPSCFAVWYYPSFILHSLHQPQVYTKVEEFEAARQVYNGNKKFAFIDAGTKENTNDARP